MTEKPRETQAESHVVELKEKVNNSSLMKHPVSGELMHNLEESTNALAQLIQGTAPMVPGYRLSRNSPLAPRTGVCHSC